MDAESNLVSPQPSSITQSVHNFHALHNIQLNPAGIAERIMYINFEMYILIPLFLFNMFFYCSSSS